MQCTQTVARVCMLKTCCQKRKDLSHCAKWARTPHGENPLPCLSWLTCVFYPVSLGGRHRRLADALCGSNSHWQQGLQLRLLWTCTGISAAGTPCQKNHAVILPRSSGSQVRFTQRLRQVGRPEPRVRFPTGTGLWQGLPLSRAPRERGTFHGASHGEPSSRVPRRGRLATRREDVGRYVRIHVRPFHSSEHQWSASWEMQRSSTCKSR